MSNSFQPTGPAEPRLRGLMRPQTWPVSFERDVLRFFQRLCWRVGGEHGDAEGRIDKGDLAYRLRVVCEGRDISTVLTGDWIEAKARGSAPVVVIFSNRAAMGLATDAQSRGVRLLHREELWRLDPGLLVFGAPAPQLAPWWRRLSGSPRPPTSHLPTSHMPKLPVPLTIQAVRQAARASMETSDWQAARALWGQGRAAFPAELATYRGEALALRRLGDFDAAEQILRQAEAVFTTMPEPCIDLATLAAERGDRDEAVGRWAALRDRFPAHEAGWIGVARTLSEQARTQEAMAAIEAARAQFPASLAVREEQARVAQRAGAWEEAARRWAALRALAPDLELAYTVGSVPLRQLKRFEEALGLLRTAMAKFPGSVSIAAEYARVATEAHPPEGEPLRHEQARPSLSALQADARAHVLKGEWAAAGAVWASVRRDHPDDPSGFVGGALAARRAGDLQAAENLIQQGQARFPDNAELALEWARSAAARQDHPVALARWRDVTRAHPRSLPAWTGLLQQLRAMQLFDDAEDAATTVIEAFPEDPAGYADLARTLNDKGRVEESAAAWAQVRARFPDFELAYTSGSWPLRRLGRFEEAEQVLIQARERFPGSPQPALELARIAAAQNKLSLALERWRAARDAFPANAAAHAGVTDIYHKLGRLEEAEHEAEMAARRFPTDEECLFQQASIADSRPDRAAAHRLWEQALQLCPNSERVRRGYARSCAARAL
jgi:tetratricopeptide (TPR) repeat protein